MQQNDLSTIVGVLEKHDRRLGALEGGVPITTSPANSPVSQPAAGPTPQTIEPQKPTFGNKHPLFALAGRIFVGVGTFFGSIIVFFFLFMIAIGVTVGILIGLLFGNEETLPYTFVHGNKESKNIVLEIPINGIILAGENPEDFWYYMEGVTYGYNVREELIKATTDENIKAVVLRMSTPGGLVTGSVAIAEGVKAVKNAKKPIIAIVDGLSASGGMWAMAEADEIVAVEGSSIGSIGIIAGEYYFFDEVKRLGEIETNKPIQHRIITAGEGKDSGNPFRKWSEKDIAIAQKDADTLYNRFVEHVASARGIDPQHIRTTVGAYVYGNDQAQELGLIDRTLSLIEGYDNAAARAGVVDDYVVMKPTKSSSIFGSLLGTLQKNRRPVAIQNLCSGSFYTSLALHGSLDIVCKN